MPSDPLILDNPNLGLSESTQAEREIVDVRTHNRGYPYVSQKNLPVDDMHRMNHLMKMVDEDFEALELAELLDMPYHLIRETR